MCLNVFRIPVKIVVIAVTKPRTKGRIRQLRQSLKVRSHFARMARHNVSNDCDQIRIEFHKCTKDVRQCLRFEEYAGVDIGSDQYPGRIEVSRPIQGGNRCLRQAETFLEQPAVGIPNAAQMGIQEARHDQIYIPLQQLDVALVWIDSPTLPSGYYLRSA